MPCILTTDEVLKCDISKDFNLLQLLNNPPMLVTWEVSKSLKFIDSKFMQLKNMLSILVILLLLKLEKLIVTMLFTF